MPRHKGDKRNLKNLFKKGEVHNPNGRARIPADLKLIRELDKEELTKTFSELFRKDLPEIEAILQDKSLPVREIGMARSIRQWLRGGDFRYVQPYFAYIYGLPKATHELTGKDGKDLNKPTDFSKVPLDILKKLAGIDG